MLVRRTLLAVALVAVAAVAAGSCVQADVPESLPGPSTFTSLQNLLYAVQWWLFGGFAVFLWQRWVRDELAGIRSAT